MATHVWESTVLPHSIDEVWKLIRPLNFSYHPGIASVNSESKEQVGSTKKVHYKDGAIQTIELRGLSDLSHSISWDLIESDPPTTVSSASYTIKLYRVTNTNETFIMWSTDYSSDGSLEVVQDQKYKQYDHFKALRSALGSKSTNSDVKLSEKVKESEQKEIPKSSESETKKQDVGVEQEKLAMEVKKIEEEKRRQLEAQRVETETVAREVDLRTQMQIEKERIESEIRSTRLQIESERKAKETERRANEEQEKKNYEKRSEKEE